MKKKEYERPTTQVVQLKQRPQLLAGSDGDGQLKDYDNWHNVGEE